MNFVNAYSPNVLNEYDFNAQGLLQRYAPTKNSKAFNKIVEYFGDSKFPSIDLNEIFAGMREAKTGLFDQNVLAANTVIMENPKIILLYLTDMKSKLEWLQNSFVEGSTMELTDTQLSEIIGFGCHCISILLWMSQQTPNCKIDNKNGAYQVVSDLRRRLDEVTPTIFERYSRIVGSIPAYMSGSSASKAVTNEQLSDLSALQYSGFSNALVSYQYANPELAAATRNPNLYSERWLNKIASRSGKELLIRFLSMIDSTISKPVWETITMSAVWLPLKAGVVTQINAACASLGGILMSASGFSSTPVINPKPFNVPIASGGNVTMLQQLTPQNGARLTFVPYQAYNEASGMETQGSEGTFIANYNNTTYTQPTLVPGDHLIAPGYPNPTCGNAINMGTSWAFQTTYINQYAAWCYVGQPGGGDTSYSKTSTKFSISITRSCTGINCTQNNTSQLNTAGVWNQAINSTTYIYSGYTLDGINMYIKKTPILVPNEGWFNVKDYTVEVVVSKGAKPFIAVVQCGGSTLEWVADVNCTATIQRPAVVNQISWYRNGILQTNETYLYNAIASSYSTEPQIIGDYTGSVFELVNRLDSRSFIAINEIFNFMNQSGFQTVVSSNDCVGVCMAIQSLVSTYGIKAILAWSNAYSEEVLALADVDDIKVLQLDDVTLN